MTINQLISLLQKMADEHGDITIVIADDEEGTSLSITEVDYESIEDKIYIVGE